MAAQRVNTITRQRRLIFGEDLAIFQSASISYLCLLCRLESQDIVKPCLEIAVSGHCQPEAITKMVRSMLSESLQAVISQTLLKKVGGGRVAAHEIMLCTPAIRNLIREDKVAQMYSAIQTGGQLGMQTLDQCLKGLVEKGMITKDAAREKAKIPEDFA